MVHLPEVCQSMLEKEQSYLVHPGGRLTVQFKNQIQSQLSSLPELNCSKVAKKASKPRVQDTKKKSKPNKHSKGKANKLSRKKDDVMPCFECLLVFQYGGCTAKKHSHYYSQIQQFSAQYANNKT